MSPQERSDCKVPLVSADATECDVDYAEETARENRRQGWLRMEEEGWPLGKPGPGAMRMMLRADGLL